MFLRSHRIGEQVYTEALESFRDPLTRKPKHRCLACWPAALSLDEAISDAEKTASVALQTAQSWAPRPGLPPSKNCLRALKAHQRALVHAEALRLVRARLGEPA